MQHVVLLLNAAQVLVWIAGVIFLAAIFIHIFRRVTAMAPNSGALKVTILIEEACCYTSMAIALLALLSYCCAILLPPS